MVEASPREPDSWWRSLVNGLQCLVSIPREHNPTRFLAQLSDLLKQLPPPPNHLNEVGAKQLLVNAVLQQTTDSKCALRVITAVAGTTWSHLALSIRSDWQSESLVERMKRHLETNFEHDCRLEDVVSAAGGSSVRTAAEAFRRAVGISPHRYLTMWRVMNGLELILETDEKVESIAYAVGFKSASSFYRAVRSTVQLPVGERRALRNPLAAPRVRAARQVLQRSMSSAPKSQHE